MLHLIKELKATSFEVPSVSFENLDAGWKKAPIKLGWGYVSPE